MSDFLENLLSRNLSGSVPAAVLPRPLARYETFQWAGMDEPPGQPADEAGMLPGSLAATTQPAQGLPEPAGQESPRSPVGQSQVLPAYPEPFDRLPGTPRTADEQVSQERGSPDERLIERVEVHFREKAVITPAAADPDRRTAETAEDSGAYAPAQIPNLPAYPLPAYPLQPANPAQEARAQPEPGRGAPVIHLTIGRIEVNAPPLAPAPSAPRHITTPARPVRSLDEYLRQRNKGKS